MARNRSPPRFLDFGVSFAFRKLGAGAARTDEAIHMLRFFRGALLVDPLNFERRRNTFFHPVPNITRQGAPPLGGAAPGGRVLEKCVHYIFTDKRGVAPGVGRLGGAPAHGVAPGVGRPEVFQNQRPAIHFHIKNSSSTRRPHGALLLKAGQRKFEWMCPNRKP